MKLNHFIRSLKVSKFFSRGDVDECLHGFASICGDHEGNRNIAAPQDVEEHRIISRLSDHHEPISPLRIRLPNILHHHRLFALLPQLDFLA